MNTRTLRIFVAVALVAIAMTPLGKFPTPTARGAGFMTGPVFHTSGGHFFAIEYDPALSQTQIDSATGYLNQYVPELFNLFWEPTEDAYVVVTQGGCGGFSCGGSDGVSILPSSWNYPNVWVHEFTHVLQFYGTGPGLFLSGDAFLLYAEPMAMTTADILAPFNPPPDCCSDLSFSTKDQGVGLAVNDYALQSRGETHVPVNAWRMLHDADPNIFKEVNSRLHQLTLQYAELSDVPSFRELIRQSTPVQTIDNLPIKQWLAIEGFLGKNEIASTAITYINSVNYYSLSSTQQSVQVSLAFATLNGFTLIDTSQSQGTVYDALTKTKLANLQVQSSADNPQSASFQTNLALSSPPAVVRINLHVVAGSFAEDRSVLVPLTQYNSAGAPLLGAQGFIAFSTPDLWLQNLNGNANVNGENYPITNGFVKLNLNGSAVVTLDTGASTQISGFLQSQQMALGVDYTALKIMQDTDTINTSTQTTIQSFSTSSTPTVTIVETTSMTTPSTQVTSTMSTSTGTTGDTTATNTTQNTTYWTISNSTATSSTQEMLSTTTQFTDTSTQAQPAATDFHFSASSNTINIAQSSSAAFTISVISIGSFDQPVRLEASDLPQGVEISFSPDPVTPSQGGTISSTATLTVARSVPTGTYYFTVGATSGSVSRRIPLTLQVSGCLIATATFGSELAPEVQFLRDFRDYKILRTLAGSSFMKAFNAWYYSFSPSVAQYETIYPSIRTPMRFVLYPLISVLKFGSVVFDVMAFNPEAGAIISGLTVSALLGAIYLAGPVAILRLRIPTKKTKTLTLEKMSFLIFAAPLAIVVLADMLGVETVMAIATSGAVLGTVTASTLWTSKALTALIRAKK